MKLFSLIILIFLIVNCSKDSKYKDISLNSTIVCDSVYHKEGNTVTYKGYILFNVLNASDRDIVINDIDSEYSLNYSDVQSKNFFNKEKFQAIKVDSGISSEFRFPVGGKITLPMRHSITIRILINREWKKITVPINALNP